MSELFGNPTKYLQFEWHPTILGKVNHLIKRLDRINYLNLNLGIVKYYK